MPKLSRWFVKSALICLVLGSLVGALPLALPALATLGPLAWHLLTVGWATQLIFGVAFWMFPLTRGPAPRPEDTPRGGAAAPHAGMRTRPGEAHGRGDERLGWAAFWLLNAGILFRAAGEPAGSLWPAQPWGALLVVSASCQVAAIAIFILFTWPRVRPLR